MGFKGSPVTIAGTASGSATTLYTTPASTESSVHGLVFYNSSTSAVTVTLRLFKSSGATTTTIGAATVGAGDTYVWPRPINLSASDALSAFAGTTNVIIATYSVYESPTVLAGFTPRGTWSSSTAYVQNDVVDYGVSSYVATLDSTNQNPSTATTYWTRLAAGPSVRGAWSSATAYAVSDIVTYAGSSYIAILAGTNQNPSTATSYWTALAPPPPKALTINAPVVSTGAGNGYTLFYIPSGPTLTLSRLEYVLTGSSTPTATFTVRYGTRSATGTSVTSASLSASATSASTTSFSSTIAGGNWVWIDVSALSGTVTSMSVNLTFA